MITLVNCTDLTGYTIIIPSIAVGNVAQLSIDLIIATLQLKRIGTGCHPAILPIFGPPAYEHDMNSKTVSFELYINKDKKLVFVQLRSPFVSKLISNFHKELINFIKINQLNKIIILSSSHAYEKHSIETGPFGYVANGKFKEVNTDVLGKTNWIEFKEKVLYGGGNAMKLFKIATENDLPCFILFKYVSEGDNSPDASHVVGELNKIQKLFNENGSLRLTVPLSWNLLFGNEPPELIF